jgi:hypothetical protein
MIVVADWNGADAVGIEHARTTAAATQRNKRNGKVLSDWESRLS